MEQKKLIKLIESLVQEEWRGFKKDQNFKFTDKEIDKETGSVTTTVRYLPKFNEMRRTLTEYGSKIKSLTEHRDDDISELARETVKALQASNSLVYKLQKTIDADRALSKYF